MGTHAKSGNGNIGKSMHDNGMARGIKSEASWECEWTDRNERECEYCKPFPHISSLQHLSNICEWIRTSALADTSTLCLRKKQDTKLLPITSPNVNRFSKFFTGRLTSKFATNSYLNIPPHLKRVTTLPCKISMFKKSQCSRSNLSKLPCKTSPTQKNCFKIFVW